MTHQSPYGVPLQGDLNSVEPARDKPKKTQPRSWGLWIFDVLLYNAVNVTVFAISVAATYVTQFSRGESALTRGLRARGDRLNQFLSDKAGFSKANAQMASMVFFSFADGTVVAPFVKKLEERRTEIARWIDGKLGTTPQDPSVYAKEPKQGWLSVLGGRLSVASIVVPTAVFLSKKKLGGVILNEALFENPGTRFGQWVETKPKLARLFGGLDLPNLFKTVFFEAFYTTVCTVGLYFSSRAIAVVKEKVTPWVVETGDWLKERLGFPARRTPPDRPANAFTAPLDAGATDVAEDGTWKGKTSHLAHDKQRAGGFRERYEREKQALAAEAALAPLR